KILIVLTFVLFFLCRSIQVIAQRKRDFKKQAECLFGVLHDLQYDIDEPPLSSDGNKAYYQNMVNHYKSIIKKNDVEKRDSRCDSIKNKNDSIRTVNDTLLYRLSKCGESLSKKINPTNSFSKFPT